MKKSISTSLTLSIAPSIFAAGCCATAPLIFMFGFSVAEYQLYQYAWHFRLLGFIILLLSISFYFWKQGITNKEKIIQNKNKIIIITIQTCIYVLVIYYFLLTVATPTIWNQVLQQFPTCCGVY